MTEFRGQLRGYQQEALDKLLAYPFVMNADEMGLGKTVTGIAIDVQRRNGKRGRTLVVAPLTGVVDSWVEHYEQFTDLKVKRINTKNAKARKASINDFVNSDYDVFVCHPEGLRIEAKTLSAVSWLHVIFDESHRIKNRKAKTHKAAIEVGKQAKFRTCLTGTPVMNRPDELWGQLRFLYPNKAARDSVKMKHHYQKLLNSYWRFYTRFLDYFEDPQYGYHIITGTRHEEELRDLIDPFYIRRLKRDVLKELPAKQYQQYYVDLYPKQRRAYDAMKRTLIAWIGQNEDKPVVASVVIAQLVRLQQFALAYGDVATKPDGSTSVKLYNPSSKLDALLDIIDDAGDKKLVVFSTSKQMVNLAEARLASANYNVVKVTGDVKDALRTKAIREFRDGDAQVFLATIGAGGTGLNLQVADTAIFLDRDWSPANNLQAEDRIHRIGQESQSVHIIDIVARDTIDQHKDRTLQRKWAWIKATVGA